MAPTRVDLEIVSHLRLVVLFTGRFLRSSIKDEPMDQLILRTNQLRSERNFLSIEATLDLADRDNVILDPWSVLISASAKVGSGNIFYPNVTIECSTSSSANIGSANTFCSGSLVVAMNAGAIEIGDANEFGDGLAIKANRNGSLVRIGSNCRLISGAQVMGRTTIGSGSQIIGSIVVQDCQLDEGEPYSGTNPDLRGAVLKGQGLARSLHVPRGGVINGAGDFSASQIELQSSYH